MRLFYSDDYVRAAHSFDTVRKAQWVASSLESDPILGVELAVPAPATQRDLEAVHDPEYVAAVRTGHPQDRAESQGFAWDPGIWNAVCASTGGTVAAARAALQDGVSGSLSSGLHHARRDRGAGFCTFNGLALAAQAATQATRGSVLIVDLDAHCGGGTASLISGADRVRQADVAVSAFDRYTPTPGRGDLVIVRSADLYLDAVRRTLAAFTDAAGYELVLYNAGMDPFEGCDVGGLAGITEQVLAERERMVFGWTAKHGWPVAFVLAGGYVGPDLSRETLIRLHRQTITSAVGTGV